MGQVRRTAWIVLRVQQFSSCWIETRCIAQLSLRRNVLPYRNFGEACLTKRWRQQCASESGEVSHASKTFGNLRQAPILQTRSARRRSSCRQFSWNSLRTVDSETAITTRHHDARQIRLQPPVGKGARTSFDSIQLHIWYALRCNCHSRGYFAAAAGCLEETTAKGERRRRHNWSNVSQSFQCGSKWRLLPLHCQVPIFPVEVWRSCLLEVTDKTHIVKTYRSQIFVINKGKMELKNKIKVVLEIDDLCRSGKSMRQQNVFTSTRLGVAQTNHGREFWGFFFLHKLWHVLMVDCQEDNCRKYTRARILRYGHRPPPSSLTHAHSYGNSATINAKCLQF